MTEFIGGKRGKASPGARRAPGQLADEVLAALWAADHPLTPSEVHETLGLDVAYNTVLTILTRLYEKGLAERAKEGRAYAYRPVIGPAQLAANRMHELLDRGRDSAGVLQHFLDGLSSVDQTLLRQLLEREERDAY